MLQMKQIRRSPLLLAAGFIALWAVCLVLQRFLFELKGTLHDDVHTYLAVGRGILNGLTPYRDLFESKPPGIFLLSAFSLLLFQGPFLLKVFQAVSVLLIPLCTVLLAWPRVKDFEEKEQFFWMFFSVIAGSMITVYAFSMAGEGLVEPLGSALSLLAAVIYDRSPQRHAWGRIAVLSFLFLFAIGLKEPFLLVLTALALLLMQSWYQFVHYFILPLGIAAAVGFLAFLALGYLDVYISIYLAHMLGYHLNQLSEWNRPFLVRGLLLNRTFSNVFYFSPSLALALTCLFAGLLFRSKEHVRSVIISLLALYLLFLAVGTGGDFYAHHYVFAVPGFVVLFILAIRRAHGMDYFMQSAAILLILLSVFFHTRMDYTEKLALWNERKVAFYTAASTIDTVMDECNWQQYLHVVNKGGGPFGFTHHSPYGPIFVQFNRFVDGNPLYKERFREALLTTPLIVLRDGEQTNLTDAAKLYINQHFSFISPDCAKDFQQPIPYRLGFRTSD